MLDKFVIFHDQATDEVVVFTSPDVSVGTYYGAVMASSMLPVSFSLTVKCKNALFT
jgi:hypothetical protein